METGRKPWQPSTSAEKVTQICITGMLFELLPKFLVQLINCIYFAISFCHGKKMRQVTDRKKKNSIGRSTPLRYVFNLLLNGFNTAARINYKKIDIYIYLHFSEWRILRHWISKEPELTLLARNLG